MTRKFKRGYIECEGNKYTIVVSKVIQSNDFGEYEDIEEEEIKRYGGYDSEEEAK